MAEPKLIANRFRIDALIGEGGMGAVYRGTDTRSNQTVAIKLLKPELLASSTDAIERFRREVEALRRLDHPNIVKLLGTAREGKHYYIVMEYIGGGSLSSYMSKQPGLRMPIDLTLRIALDLADALTRAHRLNIVHRDLKPDNVLLTESGAPRLTDFGIARIGDKTRVTGTGLIMGTGAYLSPEACRGYELDERADIWAFGVMLYEMLTGQRPFAATNPAAMMMSILMEQPPDARKSRPDCPLALANLIIRMLEKNREHRIRSVRQVGATLEAILNGDDTLPTDAPPLPDDLITALAGLVERWEAKAEAAKQESGAQQMGNNPQSYVYRGLANAYREAAQDLRDLLTVGETQTTGEDITQMFVEVSRRKVEKIMERAGMKMSALYEDKGFIFTAVFPNMPPLSIDERIAKMRAVADSLVVLETGRLQDTQQPYIDFGFTAAPEV